MWDIMETYDSYNSDSPGLTEHWVEVMKMMEILQVLSITTINLMYGCQDKTESHLIYHSDLASFGPYQSVVLSVARGRRDILNSGEVVSDRETHCTTHIEQWGGSECQRDSLLLSVRHKVTDDNSLRCLMEGEP
jgi:hypothetical protein